MTEITQPLKSVIEPKKDPIAVELGKRGGAATFKKHGSQHFKRISNLRWEKESELEIKVE